MSKNLIFATGNKNKFYEASRICESHNILLEQRSVHVNEIQHHDPAEITKAKVRSAFSAIGEPVMVNDSSWDIPALRGFLGGYMKDVSEWLTTDDFMHLMADKQDKRIFLHEVVAYYDGDSLQVFTHSRAGIFVDKAEGNSAPSFARIVKMQGESMTISRVFDQGNWETDSKEYFKHWYDFAQWYTENKT